jgi:hypothetical protein
MAVGPIARSLCVRTPDVALGLGESLGRIARRANSTARAANSASRCSPIACASLVRALGLQQRLHWLELDVRPPPRKQPRCALLSTPSLDTVPEDNRQDRARQASS